MINNVSKKIAFSALKMIKYGKIIVTDYDDRKYIFGDDESLVVIVKINKSDFFKKNYGLHNIMLLITNDDKFNNNSTKYLNMFFGYGYKYFGLSSNRKVQVFIYDISDYKDNPDWLNNKNWANPELWEK